MSDLFSVEKKRAIVTGGSRGIGLALAKGLHEAGAEVTIFYNSTDVRGVLETMQTGAKVHAVKCNMMDRQQIEQSVNEALRLMGGVDILVNCAGVQKRCPSEEFTAGDWDWIIEVNLTSVFLVTQIVGREMLKQGHGKIINLASMNTFVALPNIVAYVASKGGIGQMTKAFANEWGARGINVNAIAPGYIDTEMTASLKYNETENNRILNRTALKRWGEPKDLVGALIFLSSSASDYISGVVLPVDGGYLAR